MRQDAQTARDEHDKKMLALNAGVAAFADNMIEKFIENDSEEACKAFFENADVETNRAIIEKLWEADPDKFILAVVENLADDVIDFERGGQKFKVKITSGKSIQTTRHMIRSST